MTAGACWALGRMRPSASLTRRASVASLRVVVGALVVKVVIKRFKIRVCPNPLDQNLHFLLRLVKTLAQDQQEVGRFLGPLQPCLEVSLRLLEVRDELFEALQSFLVLDLSASGHQRPPYRGGRRGRRSRRAPAPGGFRARLPHGAMPHGGQWRPADG